MTVYIRVLVVALKKEVYKSDKKILADFGTLNLLIFLPKINYS